MSNNINDNITRFNGQYLKCVVSNYTSTKNYLANSGSLIVIQPKSGKLNDIELENKYKEGKLNRNYVYLGNEFLASGFGFGSQYLLEKAERIINVYEDDLESLRKKDRELDKKIDDEIEKIENELNKYVKTNGGHIENTVISLGGNDIKTSDIILYGEEAQYKNLEVTNITVSINDNICKDDTVFMPIGSYLKYIDINAEILKNDSGGIEDFEVLHDFGEIDETTNNKIYEGTKIKYDLDSEIMLDYDYSLYKIKYRKNLIDENYVINSYKKDVLKSFYIHVKETPVVAYKYYPGIYKKYGIKIVSSGNAIKENIISLNRKINIKPQYYAKYYDTEEPELLHENFNKVYPLNSFTDYDDTVVSFEINDSSKYIYVAIPSNFSVNKIFILHNHTEKFNWTGGVKIIRTRKMTCVDTDDSQSNNREPYYINYDIYCLETNNGFLQNSSIELHIKYNYVKDIDDTDYNINFPKKISEFSEYDNSLLSFNVIEDYVDTINDEDFNDIYWINYDKTYNSNKDYLIDKLNLVSVNGLKTES